LQDHGKGIGSVGAAHAVTLAHALGQVFFEFLDLGAHDVFLVSEDLLDSILEDRLQAQLLGPKVDKLHFSTSTFGWGLAAGPHQQPASCAACLVPPGWIRYV
jgi:hypothetical protein